MKTLFTSIVLTAALAFSSVAQAGFIELDLTTEMSNDIRNNGDYTLQTVNEDLSIEYWLQDNLAMLRFNADRINYVFYMPFLDYSMNDYVEYTYSDTKKTLSGYYEDIGTYEMVTDYNVDFIDYVFQIENGYEFTSLNFDDKSVLQDAIFTNRYQNMYYDTFSIAALDFQEVGADNGNGSVDVPEPSSLGIFALAGFALVSRMRKRSNAKA